MSDAPGMRASDADREQATQALREHYAAGRLNEQELGERLDAVYEARTVEELQHLRRDLPQLPLAPTAQRAELRRRQAELRRQLLQQAGGSLSPFAICTLVWAATGASAPFWPVWLLILPLMFLLRNGWRLYGPAPDLDRVHRELSHRGSRRRRRHRGSVSGAQRRELR
jgi:Domain of unknown function (DUF1707)